VAALAATAVSVTLPVLSAGTAGATPSGGCQSATVQYRIAGAGWTSQGGFHLWDSAPGTVEVRLAPGQNVGDGCKYPVSLAEYTTEGPTWNTSGRQTLVDKATVYLAAADVAASAEEERTWQKLTVKSPDCYGQIDLYGDDITYDGKEGEGHGPAPYEPGGVVTPYHLIAAWNGGDKPCTPTTPDEPTPTPSEPTPSTPATPTTPAPSEPPSEETTPPTTPKPSTTPPTTPDVPPLESTPPTSPAPSPSESTPPLAETGAGAPTGLIAGGAALVIAVGAGAVFLAGRRTRRS
jgi:hypothetical protein